MCQEYNSQIVKKIAKELTNYEKIIEVVNRKENWRKIFDYELIAWSDLTLSQGIPGLCILYGELSQQFPEEGWEVLGHKYLEKLVGIIQNNGLTTISMFSGASGIALATMCMSDGGKKYTNFIHSLNEYIKLKLKEIIAIPRTNGAIISLYDTIEGMSGILSYLLLQKNDNEMKPCIEEAIQYLIDITKDITYKGKRIPGWYVASENQFSKQESGLYPNGNFNTSLSHGISGILGALSLAIIEGIELDGQRKAIKKILDFLEETKMELNRTVWEGQVSFEEYTTKKYNPENVIRRDAWCYGNVGICYAYILAGTALKDNTYISYGLNILKDSLADIRGIFSATFCHGYGGILQVVNSIETLLQREIFAKEKEMLLSKIMGFYEKEYLYGFHNIEVEDNGFKSFEALGLLDGVVGVCLVLLSNELGRKTPWSRAFLLV